MDTSFVAEPLDGDESVAEVGAREHLVRPELVDGHEPLEVLRLQSEYNQQPLNTLLVLTTHLIPLALRLEPLRVLEQFREPVRAHQALVVHPGDDALLLDLVDVTFAVAAIEDVVLVRAKVKVGRREVSGGQLGETRRDALVRNVVQVVKGVVWDR